MALKKILILLTILVSEAAFSKAAKSPLIENFNMTLKASGDIQGEYSLSGAINSVVESESDKAGSLCTLSALVRKIKNEDKIKLEIWPTFICTNEGQKKQFKLHRIYLDLDQEVQKKTLNYLDQKIQKVFLEFSDLSLQKGK